MPYSTATAASATIERRTVRPTRVSSDSDAATRFLTRLDDAIAHPSELTLAALRAALTDLVDRMRDRDLTLDRIRATVEHLARTRGGAECVLPLHLGRPSVPRGEDGPTVVSQLAQWSERAYRGDEWW